MSDAGEVVRWLTPRLVGAPAPLRGRVLGYVESASGGDVATHLAEAAVDALRAALVHGDERAGAYDLLAADALLTHAAEAAAAAGPTAVEALLDAYGPGALEARVVAEAGT